MPHIVKSTILDAPTGAVWDVLRDFNGHDRWHPAVATSSIERAPDRRQDRLRPPLQAEGRLRAARAVAGALRSRTDLQLLPARYADPDVQLCGPCPPAAGHRRRPHLLALGIPLHHAHRRCGRHHADGRAKTSIRPDSMPSAGICRRPHDSGRATMPVTVKTFTTLGEAAAALVDRPQRALSRRRHAGDARPQRGRHFDLDRGARDRPCVDAHRSFERARRDRRGSDLRKDPRRTRPRLPARAGPIDRRSGGPQHGHGRRQSVRPKPLSATWPWRCWRSTRWFRCRAGSAPAICRSRNSCSRASARPARSCSRSPARGRPAPRRSATARSPASSRRAGR